VDAAEEAPPRGELLTSGPEPEPRLAAALEDVVDP